MASLKPSTKRQYLPPGQESYIGDNNHCLLLEDHDYGRRNGLQMWRT